VLIHLNSRTVVIEVEIR